MVPSWGTGGARFGPGGEKLPGGGDEDDRGGLVYVAGAALCPFPGRWRTSLGWTAPLDAATLAAQLLAFGEAHATVADERAGRKLAAAVPRVYAALSLTLNRPAFADARATLVERAPGRRPRRPNPKPPRTKINPGSFGSGPGSLALTRWRSRAHWTCRRTSASYPRTRRASARCYPRWACVRRSRRGITSASCGGSRATTRKKAERAERAAARRFAGRRSTSRSGSSARSPTGRGASGRTRRTTTTTRTRFRTTPPPRRKRKRGDFGFRASTDLPAPDAEGVLRPVSALRFHDAPRLAPPPGTTLTHPKIPQSTAEAIGVRSLRASLLAASSEELGVDADARGLLMSDGAAEAFGQHEALHDAPAPHLGRVRGRPGIVSSSCRTRTTRARRRFG